MMRPARVGHPPMVGPGRDARFSSLKARENVSSVARFCRQILTPGVPTNSRIYYLAYSAKAGLVKKISFIGGPDGVCRCFG